MHPLACVLLPIAAVHVAAQSLVIPDTANTVSSVTTTNLWRSTAGTVQLVYDATHFTRAGVTGGIWIDRLRFRGHDGIVNGGGHTYTGVTVRLGLAAVDHAAMSTNYAANRGSMGIAGTTNVVMQTLRGGQPNDVVADIDLYGTTPPANFHYDPTSGQDLLLELTFPSAPVPATLLPTPACTGGPLALHRARMNSGPLLGPGVLSDVGVAVTVDFLGPGGYFDAHGATVQNLGASCGNEAQSFYQLFSVPGDVFDLRAATESMEMVPDNASTPTRHFVADTLAPPDLSANALGGGVVSTANDAVVTHALGYTFRFPGGTATTISASTDGYVWLGSNTTADPTPTRAEFLGSMARLAPCWADHHCGVNVASNPGSGLYVNTVGAPGSRVTYVTWLEVGQSNSDGWPGLVVDTFQCVLRENGRIEFRYGPMNGLQSGTALVGFSRGGTMATPCVDPGSRDLNPENYFPTFPEGLRSAMTLAASASPVLSTTTPVTVGLTVANTPPGASFGAIVFAFALFQPGVSLPFGPQGCLMSLQAPTTVMFVVSPPATWTMPPFAIPVASSPNGGGWFDLPLYFQAATLSVGGSGALTTWSSNAVRLSLGLQ